MKAKHAAEMEERTTLEEELETLRAEHRLVYKKSEIGPADAAVALVGPFSHAMSADIMVIDCDSTLYAVAKRERDSMRKENATLTQKLQLAEKRGAPAHAHNDTHMHARMHARTAAAAEAEQQIGGKPERSLLDASLDVSMSSKSTPAKAHKKELNQLVIPLSMRP